MIMRKFLFLSLICILVLSMAACTSQPAGTTKTDSTAGTTTAVAAPAKDSVVVTILATPDSLDPMGTTMLYAQQVYKNINGYLFEYNEKNELVPSIAESYQANADSSVFTIKLKKGVLFHNGEELTAADVVYTMERGKAHPFQPQNFPLVDKAVALSDYEVEITLTSPYGSFLGILATPSFAILNEKATEELGDKFARAPVGCGPYKYVSWTEGENIRLEAFDNYFRGKPSIKKATIKFISDQNTALIGLETGEIDYSYVFPESSKPDIKANKDLTLFYYDSTSFHFITLNHNVEALSNKKVRQAINLAINREDVIAVALEGEGKVCHIPVNTNTFGYMEVKGYDLNVSEAKDLMNAAGYGNGFKIKLTAQDAMTKKIAEVVAANLSEIGITADIEVIETNTAVGNFMKGDYEMGVLAINNAQLDADFIKILYVPDGSLNLANYNNQELFNMFVEAGKLSDPDKRLNIYKQIYDIMIDEAIYVPLFFPNRAHACSSNLNITHVGGSSIAEIYNMSWKQ